MAWHARLSLALQMQAGRCVARFEHDGPLRILQTLYPEGDAIAHNVIVHPPSGIVGGDTLQVDVDVGPGAHGLVTTPGASRFYRSDGEPAAQRTTLRLAAGARLEWLPLETLCYDGCIAENRVQATLEPGAELIGWDVTALGLPAASLPFRRGRFRQHLEVTGAWLERGTLDAGDHRLMDGPLGLAGHCCIATLFLACGSDLSRARREHLLEATRDAIGTPGAGVVAGATAPGPRVIVVRALAPLVEPAAAVLKAVRNAWRSEAWHLAATQPRTWTL